MQKISNMKVPNWRVLIFLEYSGSAKDTAWLVFYYLVCKESKTLFLLNANKKPHVHFFYWMTWSPYENKSYLLSALMQFPSARSDLFIWAPSTMRFPRLCVLAALSDPAKSIINSRPILTSCVVLRTRFCCLMDTWRTAWDREDVLLAAVGSWVLSLFPFSNMSITWNILPMKPVYLKCSYVSTNVKW